jgi:membrane peptidoglycan carboxypeptidase
MSDPAAEITEDLPPIDADAYDIYPAREPELLTHRHDAADGPEPDPEAAERINALVASSGLEDGGPDDPDGPGGSASGAGSPPPKGRRGKVRKLIYAFLGIFVVLPLLGFAVSYFFVDVPSPHDVASAQAKTVTYYYADGSEMGRDTHDGNRVMLSPDQIPEQVKHAVYAAEDHTFETNTGFDITGSARAGRDQLSGGVGGGSTITQQYIKQATEAEDRTLTTKAFEIVKAAKMSRQHSKEEIITAYLNTIYFGRGAYGVGAAAQAYFDKDIEDLEVNEAAFLAGVIQSPGRADDAEYGERRFNYVMDQMTAHNWLAEADRAEAEPPKLANPDDKAKGFNGPARHIKERVDAELSRLGYEPEHVRTGGYKIHTTIDKRAQDLAVKSVNEVMEGEPDELKEGLVAVDPETGAVRAYYGGPYDAEDQTDWANRPRNPGSSIKPFDFVALLKEGKGAGTTYDGSNAVTFPDRTQPVHNAESDSCGPQCTVATAMERSVNTVFYGMVANDLSPEQVAEAAFEAGIPENRGDNPSFGENLTNNISIGGDDVRITVREMASAYATFANDGVRTDSHMVDKVTTPEDEVVYQARSEGEPAFDSDEDKAKQIAGNVTEVLQPVLPYSNLTCAAGRDCAGKTGTHQSTNQEGENA